MTESQPAAKPVPGRILKGCLWLVVLFVVVSIGGCYALLSAGDDNAAAPSTSSQPAKKSQPKAEEPQLDVPAIKKTFMEQMGGRKIKDMCDPAFTHWACFYDGLKARGNMLQVTLTTDGGRSDAELDAIADRAALHWFNFVGVDHPEIEWVIGRINGIDRANLMRSQVPLLN